MCPTPIIFSNIPVTYQDIIIDGFSHFDQDIKAIIDQDELKKSNNRGRKYTKQAIYLLILTRLFGRDIGIIQSIIASNRAPVIKIFLESSFKRVISKSYVYKIADDILKQHFSALEMLFCKFQDFYFPQIGELARSAIKDVFLKRYQDITVPIEAFIGIIPPSEIFPEEDAFTRGVLMPHLHARIYQHINHISSTTELDGKLKTVEFLENVLSYTLAGRIGFVNRPPGIKKLYWYLDLLETKLIYYEKSIDIMLVEEKVQDLSVISIDGCNIPVDCRDLSASNGTGSKGFFLDTKPQ